MAELDGRRIAAVFAADAAVKLGICALAEFYSHIHELADAGGIELGEGVELVDLVLVIRGQELACIVAREAEGHLRQVVCAEAEEICLLGDIVGRESGAGNFDHGADFVL